MQIDVTDLLKVDEKVKLYDKMLNKLLHLLEDLDLDAVKMVRIASKIKDARRKRRKWKNLLQIRNRIGKDAVYAMAECMNNFASNKEKWKKMSEKDLEGFLEE